VPGRESPERILSDFALISLLSYSCDLLFLGGDVPQALLQSGDFAEPLHPLGFPETFAGVGLDLQKSGFLGQVKAEQGTSDASVFVLARSSVGAVAGAQGDLAETEVVTEFLPFGVTRFAVLLAGAVGPALVDCR
jgi:hypothetical protein